MKEENNKYLKVQSWSSHSKHHVHLTNFSDSYYSLVGNGLMVNLPFKVHTDLSKAYFLLVICLGVLGSHLRARKEI